MKQLILLMAFPLLSGSKCGDHKDKKTTGAEAIPACVQKLIDEAARASPPATPLAVDEYSYNGKKVYLFTADCCDFYNMAYDENCNLLCAPSGGFTGGGDGKCPDFDTTAKKIKAIWKKPAK